MNINYDLLREVLIKANETFNGFQQNSNIFVNNQFGKAKKNDVNFHLTVLIQSRILEGKITGTIDVKQVSVPYGYDFLQTIKNNEVWEAVKEKLNPIDECPLHLV